MMINCFLLSNLILVSGGNALVGELPTELGDLVKLRVLDVRELWNNISIYVYMCLANHKKANTSLCHIFIYLRYIVSLE